MTGPAMGICRSMTFACWPRMAGLGVVLWLATGVASRGGSPPDPASALAGTTFVVERYSLSGPARLTDTELASAVQSGTGTNVTLAEIRATLVRLQAAFRAAGHPRVAVRLPAQNLTDGVVRVEVEESAAASESPAPTYAIPDVVVRGGAGLDPAEVRRLLAPAIGPQVTQAQIESALTGVRAAFRERGFAAASVTVPSQRLAGEPLIVEIDPGEPPTPVAVAAPARASTPAPAPAAPRTFAVDRYDVQGNSLLPVAVIEQTLQPATGPAVTLPAIQQALGALQLAYRERGYATVAVGLPPQQLTNAVVKVQVTEGVVSAIRVTGNRHFSEANVRRALPSLHTNEVLNGRVLQRELDLANANRDRQIYPVLSPGPEPGTSALELKVQDRLPWHGRVELNNYHTPGTPGWRLNTSVTDNNLWQREHQLGLSYGFTPEAYKSGAEAPDALLQRPLVAYYGGYYRVPLGNVEFFPTRPAGSARFGYDEATRQFRLPSASGRPDVTVYASGSSSDTGLQYGPLTLVQDKPLSTVWSQDSGQSLSENNSAGARLNVPFGLGERSRVSLAFGPDLKAYRLDSLNWNNFRILSVITNLQGSQTIETNLSQAQPARRLDTLYLPLSLGAEYGLTDRGGTFTAGLGLAWNVMGDDADFIALTGTRQASAQFGKLTAAVAREQTLPGGFGLVARGGGQLASGPLISNEQFSLGGINTVRGYDEGEEHGDHGWFGSVELRTPYWRPAVAGGDRDYPAWLRAVVFVDLGQRANNVTLDRGARARTLWGAGIGLSANLNNHFDLRLAVGWPLLDTGHTTAGEPRAHFAVGGQF